MQIRISRFTLLFVLHIHIHTHIFIYMVIQVYLVSYYLSVKCRYMYSKYYSSKESVNKGFVLLWCFNTLSPSPLGWSSMGIIPFSKQQKGCINCQLVVRLAACHFDSPAAFYLFVSARTPPPTHPLLPCSKTLHFISLAPWPPSSVGQGCGHPSAQTGGTACPLYWHAVCVTLIICAVCFILFITGLATYCKWHSGFIFSEKSILLYVYTLISRYF